MSSKPDLILQFLVKENCPCGLLEIIEKCGKSLGKANVQKTLDKLVAHKMVSAKTVGKHTLYFAAQTTDPIELKRNLQNLRPRLAQSQQQAKAYQSECRELETKAKAILNLPNLKSLDEERGRVLDSIRDLNEQLRRFSGSIAEANLSAADAKKIEKSYEQSSTAYRKRKRICAEMLDAIMEGYPKKKMALIEDIGVETDEAVGFKVDLLK